MARAGRICAHASCPKVVAPGKARCTEHAREYEAARGSASKRGYDRTHRKLTEAAIKGATHCSSCGQPFTADNPATGGHVVARRRGGTSSQGIIAQCRRCNYGWRKTGF